MDIADVSVRPAGASGVLFWTPRFRVSAVILSGGQETIASAARSHGDFARLHAALRGHEPWAVPPGLPGADACALERYLRAVASHPTLSSCPALLAFLDGAVSRLPKAEMPREAEHVPRDGDALDGAAEALLKILALDAGVSARLAEMLAANAALASALGDAAPDLDGPPALAGLLAQSAHLGRVLVALQAACADAALQRGELSSALRRRAYLRRAFEAASARAIGHRGALVLIAASGNGVSADSAASHAGQMSTARRAAESLRAQLDARSAELLADVRRLTSHWAAVLEDASSSAETLLRTMRPQDS